MKVLYFAELKELIGKAEETVSINADISIDDLIDILKKKDSRYKKCFVKSKNVKCAVNCEYVKSFKKKICNEDEVAFFPPVTGG